MDYFEAFHLLVTALLGIAAFTPTSKDDHVLSRLKNLLDKVSLVFKKKVVLSSATRSFPLRLALSLFILHDPRPI